jgi:uncharacterized protein GlcG (DUF336 family)
MNPPPQPSRARRRGTPAAGVVALIFAAACNDNTTNPPTFNPDPVVTAAQLKTALDAAVGDPPFPSSDANYNGGLSLNMWATVIDRNGVVVAVVFTGATEGDQWPGSRIISAQKANTANNFSLKALALSTANLYAAVQPGGSLFGLQEANPINEDAAFGGNASDYGTTKDYMVGKRIGGTNVFGGGFALYSTSGDIVGGVGVSGDTSCADHAIGWRVRHALNLDNVPAGVAPGNNDNIIYDFSGGQSAGGFGQPHCINASAETTIAASLPTQYPTGPTP